MPFTPQHAKLIETLKSEGIENKAVLKAISETPRHLFLPSELREFAYANRALSIDEGQTISQPYVVARMTELLLENHKLKKVLEIGTGSGYQAAILSQCVPQVFTIERISALYHSAKKCFEELDYKNIQIKFGDGYLGWPEKSPFDGIIITAAAPEIPKALLHQLAEGGRMIVPVGPQSSQVLQRITKLKNDFSIEFFDEVMFVPLIEGMK